MTGNTFPWHCLHLHTYFKFYACSCAGVCMKAAGQHNELTQSLTLA